MSRNTSGLKHSGSPGRPKASRTEPQRMPKNSAAASSPTRPIRNGSCDEPLTAHCLRSTGSSLLGHSGASEVR
jgi:hypothetical protein